MKAPRDRRWVKRTFGEFAWRDRKRPRGAVEILGDWERENIISLRPPVALADGRGRPVSRIRCHRLIAGPLQRALAELGRAGLSHLINTFDGCFVARHMCWDPRRPLSRHSWGIAVDLNARLFPYGSRERQDARLVRVFERQGFVWGGRWRTPDPMHFEMAEPPDPGRQVSILVDEEHVSDGRLEEGTVVAPVRKVAEALGCVVEARLEEGEVVIHSMKRGK